METIEEAIAVLFIRPGATALKLLLSDVVLPAATFLLQLLHTARAFLPFHEHIQCKPNSGPCLTKRSKPNQQHLTKGRRDSLLAH